MANDTAAGRIVRPAKNGGTKVVRVQARGGKVARWCEAAEERFLDVLGETCNVRAAAAAAGFSTTAIYRRRARWPGFAAAWDAAIGQGYARLEARLVELATDSLRARDGGGDDGAFDRLRLSGTRDDDEAGDDDAAGDGADLDQRAPRMSVRDTLNLLRLHRASVRGGAPQRYGHRAAAPDPEAMSAAILRKIEAIGRARGPSTGSGRAEPPDGAA